MSNFNWINELFASIDAMDAARFCSFLTNDCVFTMGNFPAVVGKEQIQSAVDRFFQSIKALSHTNLSSYQCDDSLFVRGTVTYTRHNDTQLTVEFLNHFKMDGSLIKDYRIFMDISQLYT